jgi:Holliday junction resolvase RusA-like endonuclease
VKVSFTIPGQPVAKGRARISIRSGRAIAYTPEKTRMYENQVAAYASQAMLGHPPMPRAVAVSIDAYMMIPQSWSSKKRQDALECKIWPTSRPDLDNIIKAVLDGILRVAIVDDNQVVHLIARQLYSETPKLFIEIEELQ